MIAPSIAIRGIKMIFRIKHIVGIEQNNANIIRMIFFAFTPKQYQTTYNMSRGIKDVRRTGIYK